MWFFGANSCYNSEVTYIWFGWEEKSGTIICFHLWLISPSRLVAYLQDFRNWCYRKIIVVHVICNIIVLHLITFSFSCSLILRMHIHTMTSTWMFRLLMNFTVAYYISTTQGEKPLLNASTIALADYVNRVPSRELFKLDF